MPKIFISYRREDSQHQADRLHAILKKHVANPKRDIFIDVDNIPVGVDFVDHLDQQVGQCDVLLALIGPDWLDVKNKTGARRLDDPADFVRIEIASALRRGIPVAPVLLDGAPFPELDQLPDELKPLARRNGVEIRRITFEADTDRLVRGLLQVSAVPKPEPRTKPATQPTSPSQTVKAPKAAKSKPFPMATVVGGGVLAVVIAAGILISSFMGFPTGEKAPLIDAEARESSPEIGTRPVTTSPSEVAQSDATPNSAQPSETVAVPPVQASEAKPAAPSEPTPKADTGPAPKVSVTLVHTLSGQKSRPYPAFSPNGSFIATQTYFPDPQVAIWDAKTGTRLKSISGCGSFDKPIFSADSKRLLSGCTNGSSARIWNVPQGEPVAALLHKPGKQMDWAALSPDGRSAVTVALFEPGAKIWDVDSGKVVAEIPLTNEQVFDPGYTPDGSRLIGATATHVPRLSLWEGWVRHVWDSKTGKSLSQVSDDGYIFSQSDDGEKHAIAHSLTDIRIYSSRTGQQLSKLKTNGQAQFETASSKRIVFSPDGQKVVLSSGIKGARLWDATTGNLISTLAGEVHYSEGAEFSPDGSLIASCRYGAYMWDTKSAKLVAAFDKDCREIEFSADSSLIATSHDSGVVKVWHVQKQ